VVISLEEEDGDRLWLTFKNFYVITRYNRSPLYAMAVFELSQAILAGMDD
jgi:membrane-bound lytic murein transglycosylase B